MKIARKEDSWRARAQALFVLMLAFINTGVSASSPSPDYPTITVQPSGTSSGLGGTAQLCVDAVGAAPLSYQWRLNGAIIPGANESCLFRFELTPSDFGNYTVSVANEFGAVTSTEALVRLDGQRVPGSDSFRDATQLGHDGGLIWSDNESASREPGEPNHANKPGGKSVWYRMFTPNPGVARFSTKGSSFDTLLAVYHGKELDNLVISARDDDRGGYFTSEVEFNVEQGRTYYIAVDGHAGDSGIFLLQWSVDSHTPLLPVIISQPKSRTVREGKDAIFSVDSPDQGLTYQWYFFDTPIEGETGPTLVRPQVLPGDVGTYSVRISNDRGGMVRSDPILLEIGPVGGVQSYDKWADLAYTVTSGGSAFISVRAGQSTFSQVLNNTDALTSAREANHCGTSPSFTRWIGLSNADSGEFEIDTIGSSVPTLLAVYYVTDLTVLNEVVCDRSDPSGRPCRVTFRAFTGTNYYVLVDGLGGGKGPIALNWKFGINMSVQRSGANCLLSWFAPQGEYAIQSSMALLTPPAVTVWSTMTEAPSFSRGTNIMSITLPVGPATRLYRLHKP